jgi:hypothetical protein
MQPIKRATETWKYIPESDRDLPEDQQTILTLSPITLAERLASIEAQQSIATNPLTGERVVRDRKWTAALELVAAHLVDVENFPPGMNGQAPKWPKDGTVEERVKYLAQFDEVTIFNIAQEIYTKSVLPADAGN